MSLKIEQKALEHIHKDFLVHKMRTEEILTAYREEAVSSTNRAYAQLDVFLKPYSYSLVGKMGKMGKMAHCCLCEVCEVCEVNVLALQILAK